jgi:transcriptional regulator with AAA-type ATPase domain
VQKLQEPPALQAKLLRVLQEKEFIPVGLTRGSGRDPTSVPRLLPLSSLR